MLLRKATLTPDPRKVYPLYFAKIKPFNMNFFYFFCTCAHLWFVKCHSFSLEFTKTSFSETQLRYFTLFAGWRTYQLVKRLFFIAEYVNVSTESHLLTLWTPLESHPEEAASFFLTFWWSLPNFRPIFRRPLSILWFFLLYFHFFSLFTHFSISFSKILCCYYPLPGV